MDVRSDIEGQIQEREIEGLLKRLDIEDVANVVRKRWFGHLERKD